MQVVVVVVAADVGVKLLLLLLLLVERRPNAAVYLNGPGLCHSVCLLLSYSSVLCAE